MILTDPLSAPAAIAVNGLVGAPSRPPAALRTIEAHTLRAPTGVPVYLLVCSFIS